MEDKKYIYVILTIILWSLTPAIAKLALGELNNLQLLLYTSIVGVISLFIVNLFQGKLKLLKKYSKKDYLIMFAMGFLGIFLYYIFLYGSFAIAPAGQANIINYLWPIFVVIFSIPILKERFNYKTILAILISFFGALIILTKGNFLILDKQYFLGYLLAFIAAIFYGLFSVIGKRVEYEKYSSMFVYYLSSAIIIIPTSVMITEFVIPRSIITIASIVLLGGVMNSIAFVFWFKALKTGDTHKTANLIYIVPFLAILWTYLFNSEPIALSSLVGLGLIIVGIILQVFNKK